MNAAGTRHKERPLLPALLLVALLFWAVCALTLSNSVFLDSSEDIRNVVVGGILALCGIVFALFGRLRAVFLVILACALGFSVGAGQSYVIHSAANHLNSYEGKATLEFLEDSDNSGFGETALTRLYLPDGSSAVAQVYFRDNVGALYIGQRLDATIACKQVDYEKRAHAWSEAQSVTATVQSYSILDAPQPLYALRHLRQKALMIIGDSDDVSCMLQALVCGYRRNLKESSLYAAFQTCGLAHLVAVSGAHLVIVAGIFGSALRALRFPRRLTIGVLIVCMLSYYVIAGMPVSCLRALIMSSFGLLSFFAQRRASSLNALALGMIAIISSSPAAALSVSFTLSSLSTLGIVMFSPLIQGYLNGCGMRKVPFVTDTLALTLSASLLSQLYASSLFSQLPLISLVANVATAPLFPLACGFGLAWALGSVCVPALSALLQMPAYLAATVVEQVVCTLANIPYSCVPFSIATSSALVLTATAATLLWVWWPQKVRSIAALCGATILLVFLALFVCADRSDKLVMLNVGQGDAFLFQSQGQTLLVDTGNKDSLLLQELARNGIFSLDAVLITHADDDHCGSLDALQKAVNVKQVFIAHDMLMCGGESAHKLVRAAQDTAPQVVGLSQGDEFNVGAFTFRVVWPHEFKDEGGNADSICLMAFYDGDSDGVTDVTAFMTGDAEIDQLKALQQEGVLNEVDILKVGHHGSRNGMTQDQERVLNPKVALISCGKNNRYGHPTQEILEMLQSSQAQVFRTDEDGEVRCKLSCEGVLVSCLQ